MYYLVDYFKDCFIDCFIDYTVWTISCSLCRVDYFRDCMGYFIDYIS